MKILNTSKPVRKKLFKYFQIKAHYLAPLCADSGVECAPGTWETDLDVNFITTLGRGQGRQSRKE